MSIADQGHETSLGNQRKDSHEYRKSFIEEASTSLTHNIIIFQMPLHLFNPEEYNVQVSVTVPNVR